ncbi:hypothetical protein VT84_07510 [Gemmata sp. SH-PL17]|uniref:AbrB/MazE/SpoVT family DNA-binding domain-containing protein n=1 Tax=Gemmata sp. SH-PL17 TaxID=1630693 RepID=UPI00078CF048|nr:AbrB/MazE/SpoVT family DNA-binding domain-containing protein [Gemmata sp. SH-PL17]AMV24227.1 hypothetical protein VT84_07510 [Gemmata sp. SH-PL17]
MTHYTHTRLGEDRRVTIPAKVCTRLGLAAGEPLVLEEDHGTLRLIPCGHLLRDVQAAFAPYHTPGESLVDELIAERRAEAARE